MDSDFERGFTGTSNVIKGIREKRDTNFFKVEAV
jgi:hypothetical protein